MKLNYENAIFYCQTQISELYRLRIGLEAEGIPQTDPVYDIIAEKTYLWLFRWEAVAALDPENRLSAFPVLLRKETPVPASVIREFVLFKVGPLNPNDHYFVQN